MKSILKTVFLAAVSVGWFVSCGLPSYDVLDAPVSISTGVENTLSFKPVTGEEYYVLAYKLYWYTESKYTSDVSTIGDTDTVSTGFTTLKSLNFIQMASSSDPSGTNYPGDSSAVTLQATGGNVILTFDFDSGSLTLTNALTLDGNDILYRRVRKVDSSGKSDTDVIGKNFVSAEYDYQDDSSYTATTSSSVSVTISADTDGIDSDIYDLFGVKSRFYGENYDGQSLRIAVAVYTYGVSANAAAIESIPEYLGYVVINPLYWDPNN
ncbi:MAG: hypothetical protein JXA95_00195 [Spirochaetales bacterium]|nr:hypothetical protein [Spirochaetales bacterium]